MRGGEGMTEEQVPDLDFGKEDFTIVHIGTLPEDKVFHYTVVRNKKKMKFYYNGHPIPWWANNKVLLKVWWWLIERKMKDARG